jgi:hypothetical protein
MQGNETEKAECEGYELEPKRSNVKGRKQAQEVENATAQKEARRSERKVVVFKGKLMRSKRNDAQRNETREALCKGVNEPQPRVWRAKEETVTKEDESATIRNETAGVEGNIIKPRRSGSKAQVDQEGQRHRR